MAPVDRAGAGWLRRDCEVLLFWGVVGRIVGLTRFRTFVTVTLAGALVSIGYAAFIWIGFISIPLAILFGFGR